MNMWWAVPFGAAIVLGAYRQRYGSNVVFLLGLIAVGCATALLALVSNQQRWVSISYALAGVATIGLGVFLIVRRHRAREYE